MDKVTGGAGADTIDLGANDGKVDTIVYADTTESDAANKDTVTSFEAANDKINLAGVLELDDINYVGAFDTQADLQSALAAAGEDSAGLLKGNDTLYINFNDTGNDLTDDMQIVLDGVDADALSQDNFDFVG